MKRELILLSIIEGSAVMIAELCGARLLAPVFGTSLYVWASVMGITLAALAAGYYYGGHCVYIKKDIYSQLRKLLALSALALALMPLIAVWLLPQLSVLPFKVGVVFSSILVLAPAVFLLGSTSPLFVEAQVQSGTAAGKVSGTVYAVSTLGGIFSTFLAAFWLLPQLGLQLSLLSIALILFVTSAIILKLSNYLYYVLLLACLTLHVMLYKTRAKLLYFSDGVLGQVAVVEKNENSSTMRYLLVNKIIQTELNCNTKQTTAAYLHLFDTLIETAKGSKSALVLGLGGGANANTLFKKGYKTTAVEFDERIAQTAKDFFFLHDSISVELKDARHFITGSTQNFDIIIADLYKAEEQPAHLFTIESLLAIKHKLKPHGRFYVSWHGYLQTDKGKGTRVLLNTLLAAGFKLRLHSSGGDENTRNLIIEAVENDFAATSDYMSVAMPKIEEKQINTDDNLCLETYNAAANESWRSLYISYYRQNNFY